MDQAKRVRDLLNKDTMVNEFGSIVEECGHVLTRTLVIQRKRLRIPCVVGESVTVVCLQYPAISMRIVAGPPGVYLEGGANLGEDQLFSSTMDADCPFTGAPIECPPESAFEADIQAMLSRNPRLPRWGGASGRSDLRFISDKVLEPSEVVIDVLFYNILCKYHPLEILEWSESTGEFLRIERTKSGSFNVKSNPIPKM